MTRSVLLGVLTVTAATLFLQIALTKLFSFRLWYHYAFMIISITMLGLSAASTAVALLERRLLTIPVRRVLQVGALLFGGSTLVALAVLGLQPASLVASGETSAVFMAIALWWILLFPPFFFSGVVVSWAIQRFSSQISTLYAFDLAGAGLGCLIAVAALSTLFAEQCIALAAGLGFAGAVFLGGASMRSPVTMIASAIGVWLCVGFGLLGSKAEGTTISASKGLAEDLARGARIVASRPGMNGRVDVLEGALAGFAWGRSHVFRGEVPPQLGIRIDGDALTAVTRFDGNPAAWGFTDYMPASLPYVVARPKSVLVIGAGGGMDLVNAINRGVERAVGVEINRQIIDLLQGPLREYSGAIYRHPKVEIVHGDGRTYVEASEEHFDVIQLTLVDTFAAISSGALALAEDFLYTTEAFQAYIDHLTPEGLLALGRTRHEAVSLLALLRAATSGRELRLEEHVLIARAQAAHGLVLLFKASPFTRGEVTKALEFVDRNGMEVVYAPGHMEQALPEVRAILEVWDAASPGRQVGPDLEAETDDAPFYFRESKWSQLLGTYTGGRGNLLVILGVSVTFGVAFILVPLALKAPRLAIEALPALWYFAAIGLGYIIVEMVLLVKLTLVLGHPTRSLTVTLFSLLLFSGIGALLSSRVQLHPRSGAKAVPLLAVVLLCAAYALLLSKGLAYAMNLSFPGRLLTTAALIAPLGTLMGMPLPIGISLLRRRSPDLVIWAWGINGFCSVLGSVLAIVFAHAVGYRATMLIGASCYLSALVAFSTGERLSSVSE